MTGEKARWGLWIALLLLVAGGVLGVVAGSQSWADVTDTDSLADVTLPVTGRDLLPVGQVVALLALAGVLAVAALRGTGRFVTGVALACAGITSALASYEIARDPVPRIDMWAADSDLTVSVIDTANSWALGNAASGLLIFAASVLVAVLGGRWPSLSGRFERRSRRDEPPAGLAAHHAWDALDRGEDPTT